MVEGKKQGDFPSLVSEKLVQLSAAGEVQGEEPWSLRQQRKALQKVRF